MVNEIEKAGITTALITNITAVAKSIGTDRVIEKSVRQWRPQRSFFALAFDTGFLVKGWSQREGEMSQISA